MRMFAFLSTITNNSHIHSKATTSSLDEEYFQCFGDASLQYEPNQEISTTFCGVMRVQINEDVSNTVYSRSSRMEGGFWMLLALRMWHIFNAGKTLNRDQSRVVEFLLHMKSEQIMPNNKSICIGSLCNVVFTMSRFTFIVISQMEDKRHL